MESLPLTPTNIAIYLVVINVLTFVLYWKDKSAAKNGGWRVPEASLLLFALLGGTPAAWFAQKKLRHKTKKGSFRAQFWLVVVIQIGLLVAYFTGNLPV